MRFFAAVTSHKEPGERWRYPSSPSTENFRKTSRQTSRVNAIGRQPCPRAMTMSAARAHWGHRELPCDKLSRDQQKDLTHDCDRLSLPIARSSCIISVCVCMTWSVTGLVWPTFPGLLLRGGSQLASYPPDIRGASNGTKRDALIYSMSKELSEQDLEKSFSR